jgi:hypothetical protein
MPDVEPVDGGWVDTPSGSGQQWAETVAARDAADFVERVQAAWAAVYVERWPGGGWIHRVDTTVDPFKVTASRNILLPNLPVDFPLCRADDPAIEDPYQRISMLIAYGYRVTPYRDGSITVTPPPLWQALGATRRDAEAVVWDWPDGQYALRTQDGRAWHVNPDPRKPGAPPHDIRTVRFVGPFAESRARRWVADCQEAARG